MLSTAVALSVFSEYVFTVVYTQLGVLAGDETQFDDLKYNVTNVNAISFNIRGSNVFVRDGNAAHISYPPPPRTLRPLLTG